MENLIRAGDLTATMAKVKILSEKLAELNTELAKWKIYVAVSVQPSIYDGNEIRVSIAKNNKQGFIYSISPATAAQYSDDPETLISQITETVFENLFKDQIRNELTPHVTRAIQNVTQKKNI